jgi:hypothetical protein
MTSCSRRQFIKTAGVSAAAASVGFAAQKKGLRSGAAKQINPSIPDTRVVCCYDPAMVSGVPGPDIVSENAPVNVSVVCDNMDEMAKALTNLDSASDAWAVIFRKPAAKSWSDVKVAIKPNCIPTWACGNHPRIAVMGKICDELIKLGVSAGNIFFYDFKDSTLPSEVYAGFPGNGLPAGVELCNYVGSSSEIAAKDILVNIAVNKGHDPEIGKFTLTMKNHYGTFTPICGDIEHLCEINSSDVILGGDPVRQQLCIVDAIWSMTGGPSGNCDVATHRLVMGTCSPAVDYMTVVEIRDKVMGMDYNEEAVTAMLSSYSLTADQCSMIDVPPASDGGFEVGANPRVNHQPSGSFNKVTLMIDGAKSTSVSFKAPARVTDEITIRNASGRLVRRIPLTNPQNDSVIARWDGKDNSGRKAAPGRYFACFADAPMASAAFSLY